MPKQNLLKKYSWKYILEIIKYSYNLKQKEIATKFNLDDTNIYIILFLRKKIIFHKQNFNINIIPGTILKYSQILTDFFNYINKYPQNINPEDIDNYILYLKCQQYSIYTINLRIACIKSFFKFLISNRILSYNPAELLTKIKIQQHSIKVLSFKEIKFLLTYALTKDSLRNFLIIATLYYTGIRVSELTNLKWSHIIEDIQGRYWFYIYGKGAKQREVIIHPTLNQKLQTYYKSISLSIPPNITKNKIPIFGRQYDPLTPLKPYTIYRLIKEYGKIIDKPLTPHWFRHTFATHAYLKGANITDLKRQLGHENLQTTLTYENSHHLQKQPAGLVLESI